MKAEAVVEFGCGEKDSFWVGVEWEGVGRRDDACFAEFGRFAEVYKEKNYYYFFFLGEVVVLWGGGGRFVWVEEGGVGRGRGGGVKCGHTDYDPTLLWA